MVAASLSNALHVLVSLAGIATIANAQTSTCNQNDESPSRAIKNTPIGSLGPSGTERQHYRYYDSLFFIALQYGGDAISAVEVGCASDPFLQYLDWIDKRTCVAPYFVDYGENNDQKNDGDNAASKIEKVTADFMEYKLPNADTKFDLLLCSQVLEHVPNPKPFLKKLLSTAKTCIISIPFNWKPCGQSCNHITDNITYEMVLKWSAPYVPIYRGVVTEKHDENRREFRRMILVYIIEELKYAKHRIPFYRPWRHGKGHSKGRSI